MISKTLGIVLLVGACGSAGLFKAGQLTRRTRLLRDIRLDLEFLLKEIDYDRSPLVRALEKTARISTGPAAYLFSGTCQALRKEPGITAREAWAQGMNELSRFNLLTDEDLSILLTIGERLGVTDAEDQVRLLRIAAEELKTQEEKARELESSGKKIWSYGGFLAGLMVALLLL